MKRIALLVLLYTLYGFSCLGQSEASRYLVVTYERKITGQPDSQTESFWILPYDNYIGHYKPLMHPFSFCVEDIIIQPDDSEETLSYMEIIDYPKGSGLPLLPGSGFYNYNGGYTEELKDSLTHENPQLRSFITVVHRHRTLVQEITKKWNKRPKCLWPPRPKEKIRVYITPVKCILEEGWMTVPKINDTLDSGLAYYLCSKTDYDDTFWSERASQRLYILDYLMDNYAKYSIMVSSEDFLEDRVIIQ